ncbi:hypothetical protein J2S10_002481 [Neobacillus ginsengisoli]|uniref:Uncharacterized protein n=1 Tax=Neobacillus ginsengisoli TaxID=904295 RepID=A0ABT9XUT6_9BACI|nr:hypothetical protein [Neobacillus ginsengisoli]
MGYEQNEHLMIRMDFPESQLEKRGKLNRRVFIKNNIEVGHLWQNIKLFCQRCIKG